MANAFKDNEVYVMVARDGTVFITTIDRTRIWCESKFKSVAISFAGIKARRALIVPNTPANRKRLGVKRG